MRALLGWCLMLMSSALLGGAFYQVLLHNPPGHVVAGPQVEAAMPPLEPLPTPTVTRTKVRTIVDPTPTVTIEEVVTRTAPSTTRTSTPAPTGGSYGINVNGILVADTAWISGVEDEGLTGFYRTSVGVFIPVGPAEGQEVGFTVTVYDSDGVGVASGSLVFDQAGMQQKFLADFGLEEDLLDGWVEIRCHDPLAVWYAYATVTDNASNDSVYRSAITRQSSIP